MSYQVLARKWRPKNFSEMVGQTHVLQALANALDRQRLHHAYLFSGTRGVGKTTVARILAKALNCEKGVSATPCGQCKTCLDIEAGCFFDLIEVDAASRTRVEDTREILDNVQYAPTRGRFKVYLIDEVHMLSGHSFNALLKTLEEPPAHVKFLLATTEAKKLPATVLSRCLQFHLKNLLPQQIQAHLAFVLQQEEIAFEEQALKYIATSADGSLRDALSLLDRAIVFADEVIQEKDVRHMLGMVNHSLVADVLLALVEEKGQGIIDCTKELVLNGANFHQVLDDVMAVFHQLTLAHCAPKYTFEKLIDNESFAQLQKALSIEDIQLYYQIALKGREDLLITPIASMGFEMAMLRMLAFRPACAEKTGGKKLETTSTHSTHTLAGNTMTAIAQTQKGDKCNTKSTSVEKSLDKKGKSSLDELVDSLKKTPVKKSAEKKVIKKEVIRAVDEKVKVKEESSEPLQSSSLNWQQIVYALPLKGIAQTVADYAVLIEKKGCRILLAIEPGHQSLANQLVKARLEEALSHYFKEAIKVDFQISDAPLSSAGRKVESQQQQQLEDAKKAIKSSNTVNAIIEAFDGKLIEGSIKPLIT